jgi:ankyrin repeat protein
MSDYRRMWRLAWRTTSVVALASFAVACLKPPQRQLTPAVLSGDVAKVQALLDDPAVDVNWNTPKGGSALEAAAVYSQPNQEKLVGLLLRRGADPNVATEEKVTPLQSAAYHGYANVVKLLIDAGADVDAAETRYGFTPLARAARNGHVQVIKLLLDAGADRHVVLSDGRTALDVARQFGHVAAANALVSYQPSASRVD